MIYFMQPIGGGPIKIGCSENVEARHKQLECYYDQRLVVLAVREGGYKEETAIHKRFAHHRFEGTEQFRPGDDLLAFISLESQQVQELDAVKPMAPRVGKLAIEMSPEFAEWLKEFHIFYGVHNISNLMTDAIRGSAIRNGFSVPPPRLRRRKKRSHESHRFS